MAHPPSPPSADAESPARPDEVPFTLTVDAPRALSLLDQVGFWGNLGVSLLGFATAVAVLTPIGAPPLGLAAAVTAIITGTLLGGVVLGSALVVGARTGAPGMVLMRGLLGTRASFGPTLLNLAQCLGWAVFELVVIAQGLDTLTRKALPHWVFVLIAGTLTTALTIRPLGAIRVLRRYVAGLVVIAMVVLAVGLVRHPLPQVSGSWTGFWLAVDAVAAVAISWVPLGPDYSRHSRSGRAAFTGGFVGFSVAQIACLLMGVAALAQVSGDPSRIFDLFTGLPLGTAAFAMLVLRETDASFADVYSTAVSIQNLRPSWDRRVLSTAIGALATALALTIDIEEYTSFLFLIGGVFIPLSGALLGAWLGTRGRGWDTSAQAPLRPAMLLAWGAGFVLYQLVNPGSIAGWSAMWTRAGETLHTLGHPWLSASVSALVLAGAIAWLFARRQPVDPAPGEQPR